MISIHPHFAERDGIRVDLDTENNAISIHPLLAERDSKT